MLRRDILRCVLWLVLGLSASPAWGDPPGPPGGFTPPGGGGGTTQNASEVPLDDLCADNADWTGAVCPANQQAADDQLALRVQTLEEAGPPNASEIPLDGLCADDTDWTGSVCPADQQTADDQLASRVTALESGGGAADAVTKSINQTGHGLSVGDWVRLSGTDYIKAQADNAANAEVVGVVSAVADVDNFTLTTDGYVTGLSGLTAGTAYFLSPSIAGALTSTDPTGTDVSKPLLVADSTTSGWVIILRGTISGSPTADWNWTQQVGAPTVTDWQDATLFGGDAALVTLADGTNGNYVLMVAGASLTDAYGAVTSAPAGDFTWCARFGVVTPNVPSQGTAITASAYAVYVDGTDLDTDPWYGDGLVAIIDDFAARLMYSAQSNGGGTDEWDAAVSTVATNGYPNLSMDTCLVRVGTTLTTYFAPYQGTGWTKSASHTVSSGAGLFAIRITVGDAYQHRVMLVAYGDPGGVPGLE